MSRKSNFQVFELTTKTSPTIITAAARTICHAFSDDAFIRWLRPGAKPWSSVEPAILAWQTRRIYQNMVDGRVFGIKDCSETNNDDKSRLPAVAFVSSPSNLGKWWSGLGTRLWLWFMQIFAPVVEDADNERVAVMLEMHDAKMKSLKGRIQSPLSYVEVVAVDPDRQGHGLGSLLLGDILSSVGTKSTVALESTSQRNIPFYEKLGFVQDEEITLVAGEKLDQVEEVKLWVMIRGSRENSAT